MYISVPLKNVLHEKNERFTVSQVTSLGESSWQLSLENPQ